MVYPKRRCAVAHRNSKRIFKFQIDTRIDRNIQKCYIVEDRAQGEHSPL